MSEARYKQLLTQSLAGIDGWMYMDEAWALHESARLFAFDGPITVVEIGSWKGRSTTALALGVSARGSGTVHAIDPHTGNREHIETHGSIDTFQDFLRNIEAAGIAHFVKPIRSTSHETRPSFGCASVHVLFVDGSHEYGDVVLDVDDWTSALTDDAVVAFNDPVFPGVYRALCDRVLVKGTPFRRARYVGNTLFFRYQPTTKWRLIDSVALAWLRLLLSVRFHGQVPATRLPRWAIATTRWVYKRALI